MQPSEEHYDVAVIGAGLAGSACATLLARQGKRVLLIERKPFPRAKVCGGCLNLRAWKLLADLGVAEQAIAAGAVPLHAMSLATAHRRVELPLPGGYAISRLRLDAILLSTAEAAGAEICQPAAARLGAVTCDHRHLTLSCQGTTSTVTASVVINAAGLAGQRLDPLAEPAIEHPKSPVGYGTTIFEACDTFRPGVIYMAVAEAGYVGVTGVEDGGLNIAAALRPTQLANQSPAPACQQILAKAGMPLPDELTQASWQGVPRLTRQQRRPVSHRMLCIGDAAGYVEPFTGEGMSWALASAHLAASYAIAGIPMWSDALEHRWLADYHTQIRSGQRWCRWVSTWLRSPRMVNAALAGLSRARWLARPIVRRLTHANGSYKPAPLASIGSS